MHLRNLRSMPSVFYSAEQTLVFSGPSSILYFRGKKKAAFNKKLFSSCVCVFPF